MNEIVLVNPPQTYLVEPNAQEHLGLLYILGSLRKQGFNASYFNASNMSVEECVSKLPDAQYYGFTSTLVEYQDVEKVSNILRKKGKKTVLGGPFATGCTDLVDKTLFDSIVVGEGEVELGNVLRDKAAKKIYYAKRIPNLDVLPFPEHSEGHMSGNFFAKGKHYSQGNSMNVITSRGCPYNCSFCGSRNIWGEHVNYRSIESVISEIEEQVKDRNVRNIRFNDDNITHNQKRTQQLCDGFKRLEDKYGVQLFWRISTRVKPSSPQMWKTLYEAGCREISLGIESYDDQVLNYLHKLTTAEDNHRAVMDIQEAGMTPRQLMMINTAGESDDTITKNQEYLQKQTSPAVSCKPYVVCPGTDQWNNPDKYGITILNKNFRDLDFNFFRWYKDENGNVTEHKPLPNHVLHGQTIKEMVNRRERFMDFIESYSLDSQVK